MERLTKRESANVGGRELVLCNYKKEDCNDSCMYESGCKWQHKALRKLKEYEDLEEQGLLLRLPCPIGTTVYFVEKRCNADSAACYGGCEKCADYSISSTIFDFDMISHVGNFYFLTKEEAEQALARMEEENG